MLKSMKPWPYALRFPFAFALLGAALALPLVFAQNSPDAPTPGPAVPAPETAPAGPETTPLSPETTPLDPETTPRPATPNPPAISPALPPEEPGPAVFPSIPPSLPPPLAPSTQSLPPSPLEPRRAFFRIGYLTPAGESPLNQEWYRSLKTALENDPAVARAMRETGISGVALRPSGYPEDLLQRMLVEEFDLVFCPAMVYVQERLAQKNRGAAGHYSVMFRTLRRQDAADTRSTEQVRHRGVLFVRRASALGQKPGEPRIEDVKRILDSTTLAVAGSYDAAGFFYIRKMLWEEFDRCEPREFLYCGTPQEAVKAVVSGLCDAGACEESVLREVIAGIPGKTDPRDLVRAIKETKPLPTDPVVIHERYDPVERRSELGRAVHDALRAFYDASKDPGVPRLFPGLDGAYDPMEDDLKLTRQWGW